MWLITLTLCLRVRCQQQPVVTIPCLKEWCQAAFSSSSVFTSILGTLKSLSLSHVLLLKGCRISNEFPSSLSCSNLSSCKLDIKGTLQWSGCSQREDRPHFRPPQWFLRIFICWSSHCCSIILSSSSSVNSTSLNVSCFWVYWMFNYFRLNIKSHWKEEKHCL